MSELATQARDAANAIAEGQPVGNVRDLLWACADAIEKAEFDIKVADTREFEATIRAEDAEAGFFVVGPYLVIPKHEYIGSTMPDDPGQSMACYAKGCDLPPEHPVHGGSISSRVEAMNRAAALPCTRCTFGVVWDGSGKCAYCRIESAEAVNQVRRRESDGRMVAPCRNCPHPYEAHYDYLFAGSLLCWTKPEWVDRKEGYQSCDCSGYQTALLTDGKAGTNE